MARETDHTVLERQQQNNEGQAAGTKAVRMCKQGEESDATCEPSNTKHQHLQQARSGAS